MAVNRFTNGAGGNTWSVAGNWSQGTIPTAVDGHVTTFDGTSPNCTVNASARVCNNIDFTGYTNTITMTQSITVSGNITLDPNMVISGSGLLAQASAGTLTSNGKTWPNAFIFNGTNSTRTLVGDWIATGAVIMGQMTVNKTTTEVLRCNGGFSTTGFGQNGTATIVLGGGTCSTAAVITLNVTIDGTCTITNFGIGSATLTYSSGTVTHTGTLTIGGSGTSTGVLNTNGITWNNVAWSSAGTTTLTLTSNMSIAGLMTVITSYGINVTTAETITVAGGITGATASALGGTAEVIMTGGTLTCTGTFVINSPLTFNGNIILSAQTNYGARTLKWLSGTIDVTTNSNTLVLSACTLNTAGMTWRNVTLGNLGGTYTINSLLTASLTLTLGTGVSTIFAGTAGFTVATLSHPSTAGGNTVTLKEAITYTITAAFNCNTTRVGSTVLFTSAHGTTRANILMPNNGSNLCNVLANFTRIDANGGRTITTFAGTITDCLNVRQFYDYYGVAF